MFISFCKVFIDENTFRVRFSWSITFQLPSFFINIVSGSFEKLPDPDSKILEQEWIRSLKK